MNHTRTRYLNTDRQRVSKFINSLDLSDIEQRYSCSILEKTSFSARDLKILLQIVASKTESNINIDQLGLPTFVQAAAQASA
jgi:hypothetical protein